MELEAVLIFLLSISIAGAGGVTRLFINGNEMEFTWKLLLKRAWIAVFIGTITYFMLRYNQAPEGIIVVLVGISGFLAVESGELIIKMKPMFFVAAEEKIELEVKKKVTTNKRGK